MRHHAQHIAALIDDPGDVARRAVGVSLRSENTIGLAVAKDDLIVGFETVEHRVAMLSVEPPSKKDDSAPRLRVAAKLEVGRLPADLPSQQTERHPPRLIGFGIFVLLG